MTAFFRVTNYDQQQHYKDRGPTWIKLYNRLLDDYGFAHLPDAAKWHLIGIQLLASRHANRVPADPAWLARQMGATEPIDLSALERAGFIVPVSDVDSVQEISGNPASTEKRREETEEKREEKISLSAGADQANVFPRDFEEFWSAYPTDPMMSKKKAHEIWRRMREADRVTAIEAMPAFRDFVGRQKEYRVVHPWKFLSERRFDGFAKPHIAAEAIAAAKDRADRLLKRGKYAVRYE
ncbi:MAG TPA: hypothetical protein VHC39_13300 [Rhizomicrobium sp.]|nr:hypothetical protein [Rhizomicrobium sp.]